MVRSRVALPASPFSFTLTLLPLSLQAWTDKEDIEVEFEYETRYSDRLHDKELILQVFDKGFLGSSSLGTSLPIQDKKR